MGVEFKITAFENENQEEPFTNWLLSLGSVVKKRILARLARLQVGNFGDCKKIDVNVFELRCFFGAGYRIYFGKERKYIVVLLCGGDKSSQTKDIRRAKQYWSEYNEQKNRKNKQL